MPPAAVRQIAGALAQAEHLELPGVGHFVEVEAPEAFTAAVTTFLAP